MQVDLSELRQNSADALEHYRFWQRECQQAQTEEAKTRAGREMQLAHIEYLKASTLLLQVLKQQLQESAGK